MTDTAYLNTQTNNVPDDITIDEYMCTVFDEWTAAYYYDESSNTIRVA